MSRAGRLGVLLTLLAATAAAAGCDPVADSSTGAVAAGADADGERTARSDASRADPVDAPIEGAEVGLRLADSLVAAGAFANAAAAFLTLRDSFAGVGDTARLARAQLGWAESLMRQAKLDSAARALEVAAGLAVEDDPVQQGRVAVLRGRLLWRRGDLDGALTAAERALALAETTGDPDLEANALNTLGTIHSQSGRHRAALEAHERLLALRRESGDALQNLALALNEIGIDYRHFGRYTDAARVYGEALDIYRRLGNDEGIAMVLYNTANIHLATGEVDRALELMRGSLERAERIGQVRGQGLLHNGIAEIYLAAGNRAAARRHIERSLEVNRSAGLAYGETIALYHLGRLELAEGRLDAAERALQAALALADSVGYGPYRSSVREVMARLDVRRGDGGRGLRRAERAAAIADSLGDIEPRFDALHARGIALEALGRTDAAVAAYLDAIELLESWRGRLALGDLRMGVADPRLGPYEGAIRVLLADGRPEAAFHIAERARARMLLELMARRDPGVEPPASALDTVRARVRERYETLAASGDQRIDAELEELLEQLDSLERAARGRDPVTGAVRMPRPATIEEARSGLLDRGDRGMLVYFWGERDVYGWWFDADRVRGARLGAPDSLGAVVAFLRRAVERPGAAADWRPAAGRAFATFVAPLAPADAWDAGASPESVGDAPGPLILAVPDGPLTGIPFEVLVPPGATRPWAASHRFAYGPSVSVLAALDEAPPGEWTHGLLAVGDPAPPPEATAAAGAAQDADRTATPPRLPHAEEEARALTRALGPTGAELLTGREATSARWRRLRPGRYRYLHFATHAFIDDRRPERTHLLLADGPLDLGEVRRLDLDAELVVLSGCETGLGRRVRGEGIIGLPHAFLSAGARGVVVSLWRVRDRSAADFMLEFYDELRRGTPPGEALRRTRGRRMAAAAESAHPARWAPFVLVGAPHDAPAATTTMTATAPAAASPAPLSQSPPRPEP